MKRFVQRTMCDLAVNPVPPKGWGESCSPFTTGLGQRASGDHLVSLTCETRVRGHRRQASDPCLENLQGKGGLASCSDGQCGEAVAALAAWP